MKGVFLSLEGFFMSENENESVEEVLSGYESDDVKEEKEDEEELYSTPECRKYRK